MTDDKRSVQYFPLTELMTRLHPQNAKAHDIGAIIESFKTHGYVASGIIDDRTGLLLAGHGRVEALNMMRKQGIAAPDGILNGGGDWEVPVQVGYSSQTDVQALAYIVADNKLTIDGGWNEVMLAELLQELANSDEIAIESSGYDSDDLDQLLRDLGRQEEPTPDPGGQVDRAAELNKKWQVKRGDAWEVGAHRIMCGDSTNTNDVEVLMGGVKADLCLTDPPYGVDIVGANGKIGADNMAQNQTYSPIVSDDTTDASKQAYQVALEFSIDFIIWGGNYFTDFLPPQSCWIIWDKREGMTSNNFADCEIAWTSFDSPARIYRHLWNGMIRKGNEGKKYHPTQKPVELHVNIIRDFCYKGVVYDPFLGSGTTAIAAEQLGRTCYGMEIAPDYVSVCLERLAGMGLQPKRANK